MSDKKMEQLVNERVALALEIEVQKAKLASLDESIKAQLPQQDAPYIIGAHKVFWKVTTSMRPNMDYIKEHAPKFYQKSLEEKTTNYYRVQ